MKTLPLSFIGVVVASLFVFASCGVAVAANLESAKIGSHQTIETASGPKGEGFLLYVGTHHSRRVVVLSSDMGSGVPTEDFRVYVQTFIGYYAVVSVPMIESRGFRCRVEGDTIKVFVTKSYEGSYPKTTPSEEPLFMTVDLLPLIVALTEAHY